MAVSTLALTDYRRPKIYRGGTQVEEIFYGANLEANSMTFTTSHFVYANSGAITDAESDTKTLGLAAKAATEVTSGNIQIPVIVVLPGDVILIQVSSANSDSPEASDTTCVIGKSYGIVDYSANVPTRVDSSNATDELLIYLGPQLDAAGDSTYWGWFAPDVSGALWQAMEGD